MTLPTIETNNRQMRDVTADSLKAIVEQNNPPTIFVRGRRLVRIEEDEKGQSILSEFNTKALRGIMSRSANYKRGTNNAPPPKDVVDDLYSLGTWEGIPPLKGLVSGPVVTSSGEIIATAGYHEPSGLFYVGQKLEIPPISTSREAVGAAVT